MPIDLNIGKRFPENQTPLQALVQARCLIEQPANWIQGEWGEDGQHCLFGALSRSCSTTAVWNVALRFLLKAVGGKHPAEFNDNHPHADVLAALDRAIANAALEPEGERV